MSQMESPNFVVGDVWEPVTTTTRPSDDALVDPTFVMITVTEPDLTEQAAVAMTRASVGEYVAKIPLTQAGKWRCEINASGGYTGTKPESITVR